MNELREQLDALAAHVRDPATHPGPPGIEARRLKIYSDLVYNNLDGLLAGGFPVIRKTLGDAAWQALLRGFLAHHHSRTPLFTELGRELIDFLESDAGSDPLRPWLAELAHYEWAELGLQLSDATLPPHDPDGDLLAGIPLLSPLAWPLAYRWPVNRIGPGIQPTEPPAEPTLVLLRRQRDQGLDHRSPLGAEMRVRDVQEDAHAAALMRRPQASSPCQAPGAGTGACRARQCGWARAFAPPRRRRPP